jgi:PAS domain S-box-containing protein
MTDPAGRLLRGAKKRILGLWEERARATLPAASEQAKRTLQDSLPRFLDEMAASIEAPSSAVSQNTASLHGVERATHPEYDLEQLLTEYELLTDVVFEVLEHGTALSERAHRAIREFIRRGRAAAAGEWIRSRDLAKRAKADEAFRRSRDQLRSIADSIPNHILLLDRDERILFANKAMEAIWGFEPEGMIGKSIAEIVGEENQRKLRPYRLRALQGETLTHEVPIPRKDGTIDYFLNSYVPDRAPDGSIRGIVVTGVDITSRRQAEKETRDAHDRLQIALQAAKLGTFEWQLDGGRHRWDPRTETLFGFEPGGSPGTLESLMARVHPEDRERVRQAFQRTMREGTEFRERYRVLEPSGEVRWLSVSGRVNSGPHGRSERMIGVVQDISEVKKREEILENAIKTREEVLGVVSHDLRNPLGSILMNAAMIRRMAKDPNETYVRIAERIERAGNHMNQMIEDLLNLSRIEAGKFSLSRREVCGCDIISESLEEMKPLAREKNILIEAEGLDQPLQMACDHTQVLRVFSNLIGNAVKFTPEGGLIRVSARDLGSEVEFSVADTGPGIAEHHLEHVFDRFWQLKKTAHTGAGLGLAIARGIVAAHGGRIWVESKFGRGATFRFTLPKWQAAAA